VESVPYCRLIDRERRSEAVQTPIGLLSLSVSGKRMTAHIRLTEEIQKMDDTAREEKVGKLLQECPPEISERIRVMFTDHQLMGAELARKAEFFAYLCRETVRIPEEKRGSSEKFKELATEKSKVLKFLSSAIPILDTDPLTYAFFRALILQAFRSSESCLSQKT